MDLILTILIYVYLWVGMQCVSQISWLPCEFIDEHVYLNNEGHTETQLIVREAILQFGQKGEGPVNPNTITFLQTGSRLDLRRYLEGAFSEQLDCQIRRYSTQGIHVRWPVQEHDEYNNWFICTIKHIRELFTVISFLRHPTDQSASGKQDYLSWSPITDRELLTTTVAMIIKSTTPSVKVRFGVKESLHCQFALDHKVPNFLVEWHWQYRGEKVKLFSHTSRSGQTHGTGVKIKNLANGDASYTLPFTKMTSEGTYSCSVSVNPLLASLDISLHIEESPRVSLNVGPTLLLQQGQDQRVACEAEGYYPLDVEIVWYEEEPTSKSQRVGAPLPKALQNVLLSSHRHNQDNTYALSAFFYLKASLTLNGKQFTCKVSHQSLRVPIKKSFTLTVEESSSWFFPIAIGFFCVTLFALLCVMLPSFFQGKKQFVQKKPY
ncbi:tapasin-related protein isoform X2 [Antennarius striatus]|uniref:tapasin-related protein isoform X2 n=1 Tax=Antennarius striatus TaxID=241820 RepID=UPI0035B42D3D